MHDWIVKLDRVSHPAFAEPAVAAIVAWRFIPASKEGMRLPCVHVFSSNSESTGSFCRIQIPQRPHRLPPRNRWDYEASNRAPTLIRLARRG